MKDLPANIATWLPMTILLSVSAVAYAVAGPLAGGITAGVIALLVVAAD